MSLYTPFQLVHAHLSPSPVAEVVVLTERPFPPTREAYTAPLHEEHALSACFDPRTATLARSVCNGHVLELRSLSPVAAATKGDSTPVLRILLPDPLRPLASGCIVPSLRSGRLVVVVLTEADVVYRFSFPLGARAEDRINFANTTKHGDWSEEWELDPDVVASTGGVGSWQVTNEDTVVLGCADGGILKVSRTQNSTSDNPQWTESHHRASSRLRIGSLFSRATDELVTSIAEFDYEDQISVVYTFSRDGKLRTWSAATGQCLKSIDVRVSSNQVALASSTQSNPSYAAGELSNSLIRVIAHPDPSSRFSHIVVVFVPTPYNPASPGTFVFYRASNTAYGANDLVPAGERPGSPASAGSELRGFEIQPPTRTDAADGWRLWAVWDSKGTLTADSVPVDDILQFKTYHEPYPRPRMVLDWQRATVDDAVERFDAAYFDNLLGTDAPDPANPYDNSDISDVFITHLFQPARFSQDTLTTALENYLERLPQAQADKLQSTVFPSLSRRFVATVGCMLRMETSPQTGAPVVDAFRKALKLEWLGIWARARELDKQARWPVGTSSINGQLLVLDREGASAPVLEDAPGVLVRLGLSPTDAADFQTLPEGALAAVYPSLAPPLARRALTALAIGGERLAGALREQEAEDAPTALDAFVAHANDELAAPPRMPVENLAASLWDDLVEPYLVSEDLSALQAAVGECSTFGVTRALSAALDLLATAPAPSSSGRMADTLSFAGFGNALLASTVSAIITARYAFARDLLLVSLYHLSVTPDAEDDDDLLQVLARAQVAYHRYRVLAWLAAQTGEEAGERARARRHAKRARGKDDMLAEFDSLRMREGGDDSHDPADTDGYDTSYSLLHSLLARALPQPVPRDTVGALYDSASRLLSDLSLLDAGLVDTEPCTPDVRLAHAVLRDGHAAVADDLTELYPLSAGMAFVRGRALLEMGKVGAAVAMLERAAAGVRDGSLADILPTCTGTSGLGEYYRRIMAVVDEHGLEHPVAHFGKLALEASEHGDPSTSDIWTRVFLAHLAMGEYEDAYTTLTSAPFQEIKRDLLGQLISAMCEANEVGRLNSLGFIGFQKDVEERLNFKARNSDPLRAPNYYTVLYSWHISRGDYRSAAEIMYAQGQRFADAPATRVPAQQLASMRAQSYLAAINALALVEPRNAWISVHADPESRHPVNGHDDSGRDAKRRRVTHYIPESEFSQGNKPVDIVTLPDMRREYTAVLAQLRLASSIPDLHDAGLAGVSLSPAELVGFFTQRSLFDYAQSSAAALDVDMTDLFVALASRCLELARAPPNTPSADFLALSPVTARLRGPPGMLALRYLQVALGRHDSEKTQWRYHAAVAETFLSLSPPGAQPPAWLVAAEMARDPQGWITRALKHGWVPEATGWSADVVRKLPAAEMLRKPDAVEGPYNLVDRVVAAAHDEDKETQAKAQALRDMVGRRAKAMKAITA